MPRGQKSKLRAREKRRQARSENQDPKGAEATAAEEGKSPSSSSRVSGKESQSTSAAGILQGSQAARSTSTPAGAAAAGAAAGAAAAAASRSSSGEGAKIQEKGNSRSTRTQAASRHPRKDPLTKKVDMLMQLLLHKYKMKEPILKADMLSMISKKYKKHFPEVLRRITERMELVFGLDLKEVSGSDPSYTLVCKLELSSEECLDDGRGFPKTGILLPLLGMIFMNNNRVTEEEMWAFLNVLGVFDGRQHFIFGEPRKLITKDLVEEKYLEYQQVPNSDPPRYELLWGAKAHNEINKIKVLEFLARIKGTAPSTFQSRYEEALRDEENRSRARNAAKGGAATPPGATSSHLPQR